MGKSYKVLSEKKMKKGRGREIEIERARARAREREEERKEEQMSNSNRKRKRNNRKRKCRASSNLKRAIRITYKVLHVVTKRSEKVRNLIQTCEGLRLHL